MSRVGEPDDEELISEKMTNYCQLLNTDCLLQEFDTSVIVCVKGNCEIICGILN